MVNSFASLYFEYLLGETIIREIVFNTCNVVWKHLSPLYMPEMDEDDWIKVAKDFYENAQFPACIGALDGNPDNSGSCFLNYQQFFLVVLMALVDSQYSFIAVDIGAARKSSDSNVYKSSNLGKKFYCGQLKLRNTCTLPNDAEGTCMSFVIVGDEALALTKNVLRPSYPNRNLTVQHRIFN